MSNAHALLRAAWETADTLPLLVLADCLDEENETDAAELIRLTVADAATAHHSTKRTKQLRHLRNTRWNQITKTEWSEMGVQPDTSSACFSHRVDITTRELVLVRPEREKLYWIRADFASPHEVIRTRDGDELLRRVLPQPMVDVLTRGRDPWGASLGFSLEHDHFPLPADWQANPDQFLAARQRQFETALAPAEIGVADLPPVLVPFVAWVLTEFRTSRVRRTRGGEHVPGAHIFCFSTIRGVWRHGAALDSRDAGKAVNLARQRLRRDRGRGIEAVLLVRVSDGGAITARKLIWHNGTEQETANLASPSASLRPVDFRRAAASLNLGAEASRGFVMSDENELRALFTGIAANQ
jgi:uncharacterized protein (TIGR02996 family)